jgi:hypothetical protein
MKNENQKNFDPCGKIPKGCFTVGGILFPVSQYEEVLEAWFAEKPLPKSKIK